MKTSCILTDYLSAAMDGAEFEKFPDGTYSGRIANCPGVVSFGATLSECQQELRATLEDWLLLGLKLSHTLPVIAGINLNEEPHRESLESLQT
jgi:predicted RNase H-like HicB family nuclease